MVRSPLVVRNWEMGLATHPDGPFCQGIQLFLGHTQMDLCPVAAMQGYINVRGPGPGPLFCFADGADLTRSRYVAQIREAVRTAVVDKNRYNSRSFRIGVATTVAERGALSRH